jgi:hypothetical protein
VEAGDQYRIHDLVVVNYHIKEEDSHRERSQQRIKEAIRSLEFKLE